MTFEYITTPSQLANCITKITASPEISVDLEFDKNRYRYGFNLCLLQIKAGDSIFLIDPLVKGMDITPVFKPLEDVRIQKVVYAFGEDIRLLHSLGCYPKNLFDISIQTRLMNYPAISLTNLLLEEQGIECGKSSQKSNWFARPLSDQQLHYAAEDVEYLLELKKKIHKKCSDEIAGYIAEENQQYEVHDFAENTFTNGLKEKDKKELTEYQWHLFNGLMNFREQVASEVNRPSHFVLDKQFLREVAINHSELKRWRQLKSVYRKLHNAAFRERIQKTLNELTEETVQLKLSKSRSASKRLSEEEYGLIKEKRKEKDKLISTVLKPVQLEIMKVYGENTASFLLSNRIMDQVAYQGIKNLPKYRQEMFQRFVNHLDLGYTF